MPSVKQIWIDYTNWRGERDWRRIEPREINFLSTDYHPEPQWLLMAWDQEKGDWRSFAIKDIHAWSTTAPHGVLGRQTTDNEGPK